MTFTKTLSVLVLATILLINIGCSNSTKYSSPDAVFAQFKSVGINKDFEGLYEILTPEAQAKAVKKMVGVVATLKKMDEIPGGDSADVEGKETLAKAVALAKKYGLTEELLGEITSLGNTKDPAIDKAVESITDPKAYCSGIMKILAEQKKNASMEDGIVDATLSDVKIDGDTATGTVTMNGRTRERTFKKIDGSWRIGLIN